MINKNNKLEKVDEKIKIDEKKEDTISVETINVSSNNEKKSKNEKLHEQILKMSKDELFKFYDLTKEQIALFEKLKKEVDYLTDVRIILVICCKKIYSKCIKACKTYKEVIDTFKIDENFSNGNYKNNFYFLRLLKKRTVWAPFDAVDRNGFHYCAFDYSNWKIVENDVEMNGVTGSLLFLIETHIIKSKHNVKDGVVLMMDCSTFRLSQIDWKIETLFSKIMSKFPLRVKKMIMFDMPWYFKFLMAIVKPFLSKKMRSRFVMNNKKDLHKYFSKENLQKEYGGDLVFDYRKWVLETFDIDVNEIDLKEEMKKMNRKSVSEEVKDFQNKKGLLKEIMKNYKETDVFGGD